MSVPVPFKTYGAAKAIHNGDTFDFGIGEEKFSVPLPIPGMALLDLAAAADEEGAKAVGAFGQCLRDSMGDDEFVRFHKASMDYRLEIEEILQIVQDLIAAGTGRPFEPSSPSQESSSSDGTGSPATALDKD